jgi:hypothetical protein
VLTRESDAAMDLVKAALPAPRGRPAPRSGADDIATGGILQERAIRHAEIVTEQLQTPPNSGVIVEQAKGSSPRTPTSPWTSRSTALRR